MCVWAYVSMRKNMSKLNLVWVVISHVNAMMTFKWRVSMAIPPLITLQFNSVAAGPCVLLWVLTVVYIMAWYILVSDWWARENGLRTVPYVCVSACLYAIWLYLVFRVPSHTFIMPKWGQLLHNRRLVNEKHPMMCHCPIGDCVPSNVLLRYESQVACLRVGIFTIHGSFPGRLCAYFVAFNPPKVNIFACCFV